MQPQMSITDGPMAWWTSESMVLQHESIRESETIAFRDTPPAGPTFFQRRKKVGKESRPSGAGGLSSREDRLVDPPGCGPPTGPGGRAQATVLLPYAGGRPISRPVVRCQLAVPSATALPRKTVCRTYRGSVPHGFRWLTPTTLLVPDAGALVAALHFVLAASALDSRLLTLVCR